LEEIEFDLEKEIDKVISIFQNKADKKNIKISSYIAPTLPSSYISDPVRLRQVLVNILGNAVKFTDSGKISIEAGFNGSEKRKGICNLHLLIRDTGIGIEQEQLDHIFNEFAQSDASTTRLYGGTGLGLTISKKLVQLMGGDIRVESEPGKGSTFHITFDMKEGNYDYNNDEARPDEKGISMGASIKGLHILLAEDSEDNRLLVKTFLKKTPHHLDMAENGEVAFEKFTAGNYDLVLMDMQMPVMDGYEATRIIRKWEEEQHLDQTVIVAFTAHALKEEVEQCIKAGCNSHISKPIKKKKLMDVLSEYGKGPSSLSNF